jgi:Late exocytosis, associated with Golgi transport
LKKHFNVQKLSMNNTLLLMPKGIWQWLRIIRNISDRDLKVISGTDGALYIIFLRYSAKLFAVITLINLIIVIPIYATGSPVGKSDHS